MYEAIALFISPLLPLLQNDPPGLRIPADVFWGLFSLIVGALVTQMARAWLDSKPDRANAYKTLTEALTSAAQALKEQQTTTDQWRRKAQKYEALLDKHDIEHDE